MGWGEGWDRGGEMLCSDAGGWIDMTDRLSLIGNKWYVE